MVIKNIEKYLKIWKVSYSVPLFCSLEVVQGSQIHSYSQAENLPVLGKSQPNAGLSFSHTNSSRPLCMFGTGILWRYLSTSVWLHLIS